MNYYRIELKFDDEIASVSDRKAYFDFVGKYDAFAIGHDKTGTSTIFFKTENELNLEQLAEELGEDIPILDFEFEKAA